MGLLIGGLGVRGAIFAPSLAPAMTSPAHGDILTPTPTITAETVVSAVSYEAQIASDAAFGTVVQSVTGLSAPSYTATTLADGVYYARFRATNAAGSSAWGSYRAFWATGTPAATVYVATTGSDTTGDGTSATPWKTIHKALTTVSDQRTTIKVAAGTYAENSPGFGYLNVTRSGSNWITVQPWSEGDTVILTDGGSSATYLIRNAANATRVALKNIIMRPSGGYTGTQAVTINDGVMVAYINCMLETMRYGIFGAPTTAATVFLVGTTIGKYTGVITRIEPVWLAPTTGSVNVALLNCTCTGQVFAANPAVYIARSGAGIQSTVAICGGTYTADNTAIATLGADTRIIDVIATSADAASAVQFGLDADSSAYTTTGEIADSTVSASAAHALLIGAGSQNVRVTDCIVSSAQDYSLVIKECSGAVIANCTINDGPTAAVYFKAATLCSMANCVVNATGNYAVQVLRNENNGHKCSDITLIDNTIIATGAGAIFNWGGSTHDDGGSICNANTYNIANAAGIGTVRESSDLQTLAALQTAWSGYDVSDNDSTSTVVDVTNIDFDLTLGSLPSGVLLSRSSSGTRYNVSGASVIESSNVARFDYNPSTLAAQGLLIEPQRTNFLLRTTMTGGGAAPTGWTQLAATGTSTPVASAYGAADGGIAYSQSATAERPFFAQDYIFLANTTYFFSVLVEAISGTIAVNNVVCYNSLLAGASLQYCLNGVPVSPTDNATTGEIGILFVIGVTGGIKNFRVGLGGNNVATGSITFSRPQLEIGSNRSKWIPTTTGAATRNNDVVTFRAPPSATVRFTFDDSTTQDVTTTAGIYTVPNTLSRFAIKRVATI